MFSDAPPCLEQLVTSLTCFELVLNRKSWEFGIQRAATVPQLMMIRKHPPQRGLRRCRCISEIAQEQLAGDEGDDDGTNEVSHTRWVSGVQSRSLSCRWNMALLMISYYK